MKKEECFVRTSQVNDRPAERPSKWRLSCLIFDIVKYDLVKARRFSSRRAVMDIFCGGA